MMVFIPLSFLAHIHEEMSVIAASDATMQQIIDQLCFEVPDDLPFEPRSIALHVRFSPRIPVHLAGVETFIPPTYFEFSDTDNQSAIQWIERTYPNTRFQYAPNLPTKALAVHAGLARYGRNNIAYVDGFGSFVDFSAYWSDKMGDHTIWQQRAYLNQCEGCELCVHHCPTDALSKAAWTSALRCVTWHNESTQPFPEWLPKESHNSLIGCMRCQEVCPVNQTCDGHDADLVSFSEEETAAILHLTTSSKPDPLSVTEKLALLGFIEVDEYVAAVLPRNAAALLKAQ